MGIVEVVIQVGDVEQAVAFYSRACGFAYVRTVEDDGVTVVEMDAAGQRVTLVPAPSPGIRLALGSRDAALDGRRAKRAGGRVDTEPRQLDGGAWVGCTDPWGNPLGFLEVAPG